MSDAMRAWQQLRAGEQTSSPPGPIAAVFRCADDRLPGHTVFRQDARALVDISTWGHTVDTSVLASFEYAVVSMGVPLIVVLGHDSCPAMGAARLAWEHAQLPEGAMRATVEHALMSVVRRGASADSVASVTAAHIVETGLSLAQRSPVLARRIDTRECGIVCATYGPDDRRIRVHATIGAVGETTDALAECV